MACIFYFCGLVPCVSQIKLTLNRLHHTLPGLRPNSGRWWSWFVAKYRRSPVSCDRGLPRPVGWVPLAVACHTPPVACGQPWQTSHQAVHSHGSDRPFLLGIKRPQNQRVLSPQTVVKDARSLRRLTTHTHGAIPGQCAPGSWAGFDQTATQTFAKHPNKRWARWRRADLGHTSTNQCADLTVVDQSPPPKSTSATKREKKRLGRMSGFSREGAVLLLCAMTVSHREQWTKTQVI